MPYFDLNNLTIAPCISHRLNTLNKPYFYKFPITQKLHIILCTLFSYSVLASYVLHLNLKWVNNEVFNQTPTPSADPVLLTPVAVRFAIKFPLDS